MHVYVLTHWSDESGVYEYSGVFKTLDSAMKYVGGEYGDETVRWACNNTNNIWTWEHSFGRWVISVTVPR